MWIYVWDTEIKWIYLWDTLVKEVYLWDTKIRPSVIPITTPWIYHNSDLWLISLSSNGTTWLTIADKNLWATSTDVSSSNSYWNYYQWWNNYWFPNSWSVTKSSTAVNASTYWPTNYYNSSTFITATPRDSSNNNNLWGNTTNTNVARKWPCDTNFHIPSKADAQSLIDTLYAIVWGKKLSQFEQYLFMGKTQVRSQTNWNVVTPSSTAYYQTSTQYSNNAPYTIRFWASTDWYVWGATSKAQGFPIRPFKDTPLQPREWDEREKLYPTPLKSYAEIKSMFISDRNTWIAELNTHPVDYYNKFSSEWKLYNLYWYYFLSDNWQESWLVRDAEYYSPVYNEWVWQAWVM